MKSKLFIFFSFISKLQGKFHSFHPVATILSYLTKAPLVRRNYVSNFNVFIVYVYAYTMLQELEFLTPYISYIPREDLSVTLPSDYQYIRGIYPLSLRSPPHLLCLLYQMEKWPLTQRDGTNLICKMIFLHVNGYINKNDMSIILERV